MDKVITKSFDFLDKYKEWKCMSFLKFVLFPYITLIKGCHYSVGDLFTGIIM